MHSLWAEYQTAAAIAPAVWIWIECLGCLDLLHTAVAAAAAHRSRSIEIGFNILYNESKISCWLDFTRFSCCVDPISRDFVFVLTRFHEISCLGWPDFTMLNRFNVIYCRHHRNFDLFYSLAPQYKTSLCVLYVCAAEYSGRSHIGTRLSLLVCCSKWLVMILTSKYQLQSQWVTMMM